MLETPVTDTMSSTCSSPIDGRALIVISKGTGRRWFVR
jgi:hypothetical protein